MCRALRRELPNDEGKNYFTDEEIRATIRSETRSGQVILPQVSTTKEKQRTLFRVRKLFNLLNVLDKSLIKSIVSPTKSQLKSASTSIIKNYVIGNTTWINEFF